MTAEKLSEHDRKVWDEGAVNGMVIAAAILVRVWGEDVQAEEILGAAGCTTMADMRRYGVDAYDVWPLRRVMRSIAYRRGRHAWRAGRAALSTQDTEARNV